MNERWKITRTDNGWSLSEGSRTVDKRVFEDTPADKEKGIASESLSRLLHYAFGEYLTHADAASLKCPEPHELDGGIDWLEVENAADQLRKCAREARIVCEALPGDTTGARNAAIDLLSKLAVLLKLTKAG